MTTPPTLLVTGANGQLGRLVVEHLLDTVKVEPSRIIATTRNPAKLADFAARGVTVRAADFAKPETLAEAFKGADRLLLISTTSVGTRLVEHQAAIDAAVAAGVQHVLYTSIPNPVAPELLIVHDHAKTEDALAASQLPGWTVLRNNWYFENLNHTIPQLLQSGQWFNASGDGRIAYIARSDLARAAATALANGDNGKSALTLGGATAYTVPELAALIGSTLGGEIAAIPVTVPHLEQGMIGAGLPAPVAAVLSSAEIHIANGRLGDVSGDYRALTGAEPQSLESWLVANKAALAKAA
ncbi:NAD(P)-dependent oxidoreductase [Devosia insulae DS-56]|uniref:NAD(P)-dependent oxidoreductase n=1 Tax=Devosia insulae DS-56 TaxID=1116389 RepID=A0A1E5XXD5_9HYPH|nr:NAD(P)H-binding protein [Devosia insulae]OEO33226.1 NAD(P)-dependent oxidoreductase [Devosia insulae DS-56]